MTVDKRDIHQERADREGVDRATAKARNFMDAYTPSRRKFVGVTQGMCGWTAVLYDVEGPITTGIGGYHGNRDEAVADARDWAEAEGYELEPGL